MPTKHHSNRGGVIVDTFVEHFTAGGGTAASTALYMERAGNSAHAIVGRVGDLSEPVPLDRAAWHAGDHNKAYTRGSRLPSAAQLADLASGARTIIPIGDVPYRRKVINARTVGVEWVNLGPLYPDKADAVKARHRNPLVRDDDWQPYTPAQIEAGLAWHERVLEAMPSIRYVIGHEDLTHADTLGDDPSTPKLERVAGGKLDPGPAFPWDVLCSRFAGRLVRVMYDFKAHGWVVQR